MINALIGHLVGDYLIQNDWMALNKKKRSLPCAVHCVLWTLSVCSFAGWWNLWVIALLFVTHFIQDRTNIIREWMSLIGQEKFATGPCSPWSIIVVDNVWHIVTLWSINEVMICGSPFLTVRHSWLWSILNACVYGRA